MKKDVCRAHPYRRHLHCYATRISISVRLICTTKGRPRWCSFLHTKGMTSLHSFTYVTYGWNCLNLSPKFQFLCYSGFGSSGPTGPTSDIYDKKSRVDSCILQADHSGLTCVGFFQEVGLQKLVFPLGNRVWGLYLTLCETRTASC